MDEPTAGVEPRVAALICDLIIYLMQTGTVRSDGSREAFGGDSA